MGSSSDGDSVCSESSQSDTKNTSESYSEDEFSAGLADKDGQLILGHYDQVGHVYSPADRLEFGISKGVECATSGPGGAYTKESSSAYKTANTSGNTTGQVKQVVD